MWLLGVQGLVDSPGYFGVIAGRFANRYIVTRHQNNSNTVVFIRILNMLVAG